MFSRKEYVRYFIIGILFTGACLIISSCKKNDVVAGLKVEKIESHTTDRLNSVTFINNIGYTVGGDRFNKATILISRDGGYNWEARNFPEAGKALYGITQKYDNLGVFAIGFESNMLSTTDDGNTWNHKLLGTWRAFKDLAFIEPQTCIMIGGISYKTGYIGYVNDDGVTYKQDSLGYELNDIEMLNNKTGYIAGFGVMLKTTDGAVSWQMQDIKNDNFTAMHVKNEQELWVCGYNGSVYHTNNGGQSWDMLRNGNSLLHSRYRLLDIYFKDDNTGWAVGENGVVIYTNSGGKSWTEYKKFTDEALRSIAVASGGHLVVCGDNGALYRLYTH